MRRRETILARLYDRKGILLYEGDTLHGKPCGMGTAYYASGRKYQEGRFDIKGLVEGREYYPNGRIRFEGVYRIHRSYGPNPPIKGTFYAPDGRKVYSGYFTLTFGGVGYPTVVEPREYGAIPQKERPAIPYLMWND